MRVTSPPIGRRLRRVIVGIIILRHVYRGAFRDIAVIFLLKRAAVIFKVVKDIQRAVRLILDQTGARLVTCNQAS